MGKKDFSVRCEGQRAIFASGESRLPSGDLTTSSACRCKTVTRGRVTRTERWKPKSVTRGRVTRTANKNELDR